MLRTIFVLAGVCYIITGFCQNQASVIIDADKPGNRISPNLHGIFFEEISHAGEGGLYGELIQNRGFEESRLPQGTVLQDGYIVPGRTPHFSMPGNGVSDWKMEWPLKSEWPAWSLDTSGGSEMKAALTDKDPLNTATPHSMQLSILKNSGRAGLVNEGFWGIGVRAGENYLCSFYIHTDKQYNGSVKASLQSADGAVLASFIFNGVHNRSWKKYNCVLKAAQTDPAAKFVLSFGSTGTVWVDFVSLFPERTFRNRPNGLRLDLAQSIADLNPAFIRWPGGCFVEGINIQSAPDWRRTIGPVEERPGTYSPWGYWTSDGFGYHEYLQFCEDIGAAALYVFNVGVSCDYRSGTFAPEDSLGGYIQNALDAIEYAVGPVDSKWGRKRATSGHPAPFPLKYVEVGNEQHGPLYAKRYNLFYEAIKTKYPDIKVIASMGIGDVNTNTLDSMKEVELVDEHAYKSAYWAMSHYDHFDRYRRGRWDMYVGEYATNNGVGRGNMEAALSDAVYIMGMERNGDLVKMSSYAPLLVNVNDEDWPVNLINFNASQSFGRISYYALKMLAENRTDINLSTRTQILKTAGKKPLFTGSIGLATWDTQTEYKDIEVIQNGQTLYKSDFISGAVYWTPVRGEWKLQDSGLAQIAEGPQLFAMLKDRSFDTYTLTLKAKKLGGLNAFIIPFAVKDTNTCMRAHIGSWLNSHCVIEKLTNGYDVSDLSEQKKLPKSIEQGRWYAIRLEVGVDTVKCWLDDELIMTYTEPEKFFALAGKNEKTGDLIVKVVNGSDIPYQVNWRLNGTSDLSSEGELTVLQSETAGAENSFRFPKKYVPEKRRVTGVGSNFETTVPPFSISVLMLKEKKLPR
ncbi:alpha-L-arabinofuranosidase C-terminal domain-containing protein [Flavitalea flava]